MLSYNTECVRIGQRISGVRANKNGVRVNGKVSYKQILVIDAA